ncbi:hypothetical protein DFJ58DRAFT_878246 [Suillus subalutaceus]|uniref:uncharacterized protein n=1 Tax=Suillus subalutaceus TaxID=48586 RepID=UPI001B86C798|nr:uncharacterized protein DFJ58DRAFT_878246 [Suillus subalutaceus]KAG1857752.1 hypothetical protein DFJ58DRAFT_878246 [Suillus subalutaceus]
MPEPCSDSKSVTNAPPSYTTTSTSALVDSLQLEHKRFSPLQSRQTRNTVLTCIRDIVSAPDFTPSSAIPIVDACAAALSATKFSDLLQTPNIEGHTALYWAIVNERPEAFSALSKFIPKFSSACSSDLRLACMSTSDQALFSQLNLGNPSSSAKEEPLRRSSGFLPDEVQVESEDGLGTNQFIARLRIRKFQKRLLITGDVGVEFVAGGRIWLFRSFVKRDGKWYIGLSLAKPSLPARPGGIIVIKPHSRTPGSAAPSSWHDLTFSLHHCNTLVPAG